MFSIHSLYLALVSFDSRNVTMSPMSRVAALTLGLGLLGGSQAQKCAGAGPGTAVTNGKGFQSYLLTDKLTGPRGLVFDSEGNLLVSQRVTKGNLKENGIYALKLKDEAGCVSMVDKKLIAPHPKSAVSVFSGLQR
jgi:hypothetical protein